MEKKKTTKSTQSMLMFVAIRKNNYKQTIYAYVLLINLSRVVHVWKLTSFRLADNPPLLPELRSSYETIDSLIYAYGD